MRKCSYICVCMYVHMYVFWEVNYLCICIRIDIVLKGLCAVYKAV